MEAFAKHYTKSKVIGLIISLLVIGKVQGQDVFIPKTTHASDINVLLLPTPAPVIGRSPEHVVAQNGLIQTVTIRNPQRAVIERTGLSQTNDLYRSPPTTAKTIIQTRKFTTQNEPDKMNRPSKESPANATAKDTGRVKFEKATPKPVKPLPSKNPVTNETSFQPVDKNGTKITFDDRASFKDGDKCPTGYVRYNDVCVPEDS